MAFARNIQLISAYSYLAWVEMCLTEYLKRRSCAWGRGTRPHQAHHFDGARVSEPVSPNADIQSQFYWPVDLS